MQNRLPQHFLEKLKNIYTPWELEIIQSGFSQEKRPVTLRVNTLKSNPQEIEEIFHQNNILFEKIDFLSHGYILPKSREKDIWHLDFFKEWKIYLQWIASQIIWELLKKDLQNSPQKILDLTAAPGWKTSHISALMGNKWEITANELAAIRREKLVFTLKRQWTTNVVVSPFDARKIGDFFPKESFDILIADLMCSAEWRISLSQEKSYLYLENTWIYKKNYLTQKEILSQAIPLLKPNGILMYSTCTLDPRENEGIIHFIISNFPEMEIEEIDDFFQNKKLEKISKNGISSFGKHIYNSQIKKTKRILPSSITEGFYIAKLRKKWA